MARVKRGVIARARHKKILKQAKGYYGARSRVYRVAFQAVIKAGQYAYRDRRQRKRQFRQLWIARINAAARQNGINFWHFNNFHFALLINETKANKACEARRLHRQCYLKALLFLLRSEHHDHLAAFDLRWEGFDHCQFLQIVFHAIKHFHTDLLVRHLTTAETQRDFGFITLFEKANQAAEFYLIVAFK